MKRIWCWFAGHKPYLDYSGGEWVEPNVFVGPVRRYCNFCGITLPGDSVQVGDTRIL